ncbi:hypothetical protein NDU88_001291 [Pleurodeles waltl]|uniref:Uncharacterized protein n=1 Tax=Pleurodeles waltl TaxID=8319 RepID=A0AAV7MM97_PLEWA|nr:hypothetical protein NDU88_001291 [Pleurodeles waltl]
MAKSAVRDGSTWKPSELLICIIQGSFRSRIAGYADSIQGKRCSRSRVNSVTGCPDDWRAGVGDANPDFRVWRGVKSDDGNSTRGKEENDDRGIAETEGEIKEEPTASREADAEEIERGRDPGNCGTQEPTKEATESSPF